MRVAVVGRGPAAVGVLRALSEWCANAEITVFDIARDIVGPFATTEPPDQRTLEYEKRLYRHLRGENGFAFPPPKTNFGQAPDRLPVDGWGHIWEGRGKGGLSNFWGGLMLPYTDRELRDWPIRAADLSAYYRHIAELVGVAGREDGLNRYFGVEDLNRPPIRIPALADALIDAVNGSPNPTRRELIAGAGRLALETSPDQPSHCIYTGACMTGCPANALYNAGSDVDRFLAATKAGRLVDARVLAFDSQRQLRIDVGGSVSTVGPFDRVYLAAGCAGTTKIIMRSLDLDDGPTMVDNTIHSFPILYLGKSLPEPVSGQNLALCNVVVVSVPSNAEEPVACIQVYPSIDYLWQYYVPVRLWPLFEGLGRSLRRRFMIGRLYVDGEMSQRYRFRRDSDGEIRLGIDRPPRSIKEIGSLWQDVRNALGREGFYIPPATPRRQRTSSHYTASFPAGRGPVDESYATVPGVYVCDGTAFGGSPAFAPTFTIMANACRIAHRSLDT